MMAKHCYWSVATGPYAAWMERCVASARAAGVFKEFHVLTDREIPGCHCHDAMGLDLRDGMFKLIYLKAAITNLHFDHYVWVDADTMFTRNPDQLLAALRRGPIHVPLGPRAETLPETARLRGLSPARHEELMRKAGVYNEVHASRSAFWLVKRAAVDVVCELAQHYHAVSKTAGEAPHGDDALGFAMQMLCGDPQAHLASRRPELWASDETGECTVPDPLVSGWNPREPLAARTRSPAPAIMHLPGARGREMGALRASMETNPVEAVGA